MLYEVITGQPDGYNTELTRAIAEVMGIRVEIQLGDWDTMRKRLENGEIDVLQGITYSAERAKSFSFAPPHALVHQSLFARQSSTLVFARRARATPISFADLKGKEVIVQRGSIMSDYRNNFV